MTNILLISTFDNGGSMQQLCDALNKYTEHDCRHLNYVQTYLNYDVDINANDFTETELKYMLSDREFFIFSEAIPDSIRKIGIEKKLNKTTSIIRCFGSITRDRLPQYRSWWYSSFTTFTSGGFDPTIHPYLGFVAYHIPNIYNFDKFPKPNRNNKIKICHAATNQKLKNTKEVMNVLEKLEKDIGIEPILITNTSWEDSLKIKATCHITIDQFKLGTYASSSIESMYLGHTVISKLSPFIRSMHPDIPIIQADLDNLYDVIKNILFNSNSIDIIGNKGRNYAIKEHSAELNVVKWDHLIKWVNGGFQ